MSLNVHCIHFDADEKLISLIKQKSQKLNVVNDSITSIDVYLKLDGSQHIKDKIVEMKINIPGDTIFVKAKSKSFEESLLSVLDSSVVILKKRKEIFN